MQYMTFDIQFTRDVRQKLSRGTIQERTTVAAKIVTSYRQTCRHQPDRLSGDVSWCVRF